MGGSYSRQTVAAQHFPEFKAGLPKLVGKTIAITGTTSGTGSICAQTVGELGARVILLNRPSERSTAGLAKLQAAVPAATFVAVDCDLQSFASVRAAGAKVRELCGAEGLDALVNNAGVMALADLATTDGYDVQMQTNHLSHFLLTKEVFSCLEKAAELRGEARIVNHSSLARRGKALQERYLGKNGGDLDGDSSGMMMNGPRWQRYQQTKLANCVFTYALVDRIEKRGVAVKALVAHPGLASTELQATTHKDGGMGGFFTRQFMKLAQSQEDGAMGIILCACGPDVATGDFYGPARGIGLTGPAEKIEPEALLTNDKSKEMLWRASGEAIGEPWDL